MSTYFIAIVWLGNGLFAKILNLVPRHGLIVQTIFQDFIDVETSFYLTKLIGISEIVLAFWILSRYKSRLVAILQIILVITMNIIEFALVDDLLLFGKWNLVIALFFSFFIYWNEFVWKDKYL
ncbi:DoxX-like family protein [Bernardetia sp. OM2101]|uniref:DoxX-like family protein n=1 Tax=Bernardetia sp. OM2101 TaxID=3344876 RepID=UPI0035CFAFA6